MSSQWISKYATLIDVLKKCPEVTRYDEAEYSEAEVLAHAFSDLEESFRKFLDDHLPKLLRGQEASEICDLLEDIGEELRHILYHIKSPKFYRYLRNDEEV